MTLEFARVLRQKLREDMNQTADALATGSCKSFEDYRHLCGVIQGLAIAERHLLDLHDAMEKADE